MNEDKVLGSNCFTFAARGDFKLSNITTVKLNANIRQCMYLYCNGSEWGILATKVSKGSIKKCYYNEIVFVADMSKTLLFLFTVYFLLLLFSFKKN